MVEESGVVVLYGPKAAGKSAIAKILAEQTEVHHVNPDVLVAALLAAGREPDADSGWLEPVEEVVRHRQVGHRWVVVEATGAWASDWALAERLEQRGVRVVRVWVTAPLEVTLRRLTERRTSTVKVSEMEARRIFQAATANAANRRFDAVVDTEGTGPQAAARHLARHLGSA